MGAEVEAVAGFAGVELESVPEGVLGRPARGLGGPVNGERGLVDVEGVGDEPGAGEMAGGADDLG